MIKFMTAGADLKVLHRFFCNIPHPKYYLN